MRSIRHWPEGSQTHANAFCVCRRDSYQRLSYHKQRIIYEYIQQAHRHKAYEQHCRTDFKTIVCQTEKYYLVACMEEHLSPAMSDVL